MPAKNKIRVRGATAPIHAVKSLVLHDVTPPPASSVTTARRARSVMPGATAATRRARVSAARTTSS